MIEVTVDMKIVSVANIRLHWAVKARLVKGQRQKAFNALCAVGAPAAVPVAADGSQPVKIKGPEYANLLKETTDWVKTIQNPLAIIEEPQKINPVGQQQTSLSSYNDVSIVDFLSVVLTYIPWGIYYAGNVSNDNILLDLLNRSQRNAVITGNITKNIGSGNGAVGNIASILGSTNTTIEFPNNSIPDKFTICSITRYTNSTANNKRILTAKNASLSNDWIHGHSSGKKGVVYYNNEFKTNNTPDIKLSGELTDWVITCAKNDDSVPNNIYINGIPSGVKPGGKGGLNLSINKIDNSNIINEMSDFALSYVIIWDSCLSNKALKIISDSLVKYLHTGEQLLFDMSSLTDNDKFKVIDAKTSFIKNEIDDTNAALLEIKKSSTISIPSNSSIPSNNIDDMYKRIIAAASKAENLSKGTTVASVINLNPDTSKITTNNICNSFTDMPEPDTISFTELKENIPTVSDNNSYKSYIWCKCNDDFNKTDRCKTYDICRDNYATFKNTPKKDIPENSDGMNIYKSCKLAFPKFPNYLD